MWTSPAAPRESDRPAVLDHPELALWLAGMDDLPSRAGLHGRTLTQLLMGEPVQVVEETEGWARVVALRQPSSLDDRGYPGWVPSSHLGRPANGEGGTRACVRTTTALCHLDGGGSLELSCGTTLWVDAVDEQTVGVRLPESRRGRLRADAVTITQRDRPPPPEPDDLLSTARQFLGVRYLWGGTSAWGVDCSGLVQLAYRAHGIGFARDAHDQEVSPVLSPVDLDEVVPGDLYFFARAGKAVSHVGFVTAPVTAEGTRWMLHAPEDGEAVEEEPLAPHRLGSLVSAGRVRS